MTSTGMDVLLHAPECRANATRPTAAAAQSSSAIPSATSTASKAPARGTPRRSRHAASASAAIGSTARTSGGKKVGATRPKRKRTRYSRTRGGSGSSRAIWTARKKKNPRRRSEGCFRGARPGAAYSDRRRESIGDVRFERPRFGPHDDEARHAGHAVDAIARAQLARRADHDLAHRADHLVRRERVERPLPFAVEAPPALRHLVEPGVLEEEALPRFLVLRGAARLFRLQRIDSHANPRRSTDSR